MVRLTRWLIGLVILVIVGALFVDGFGAGYQYYASHVNDPNIGCNDVSLRASGLSAASGSFTIRGADSPNLNKLIDVPIDATTQKPSWSDQWSYNLSKGGGQQIAVVPKQALTDAAAKLGIKRDKAGYHLEATIGSAANDVRTFWLGCTATPAPKPSPTATPVPTPKPSPTARPPATPKPTPTPPPPPITGPKVAGSFWIDGYGAPSILGQPWTVTLRKGLDLVGGSKLTIVICHGPNNPPGSTCRSGLDAHGGDYPKAQAETLPILQQRVNGLGVAEAVLEAQGDDKIVVQLPGISLDEAVKTIGTTAKLHFATAVEGAPDPNSPAFLSDQQGLYDVNQFSDPSFYPPGFHWKIDDNIQATNVSSAAAGIDQGGQPSVNINFDGQGASEWGKITTAAAKVAKGEPKNRVAIFLDNKVLTAPQVNEPSSAATQITGGFTTQTAKDLANQISAGALPADISTIQSTSVSATLGQQTVRQALIAGGVGLIIVIFFMIGYYRFPGILASLALICYAAIVLAVFKLIGVTISLPGLAGFLLSVGMAVDANVLIFERIRDELRHGRPMRTAVETGFRRAFPAIRDSNISTGIACAILYWLGSDVVRGFAITLGIGVAVSFLSAVVITQALFAGALKRKFGRNPRAYTEIHDEYREKPPRGRFDIVKSRNLFFLGSLLIIVPGLLAILFWGFRLGLDFSGGNLVDAHLKTPASLSQVQTTVDSVARDLQPSIQAESGNRFSIRTLPAPINRVQQISSTLEKKYGFVTDPATGRADVQIDTVGPTIAADLVRTAMALVLLSSLFIALYLAFVFGRQRQISRWRFSACTFFKLLHDVFVLIGLWAILGHFSPLGQVDILFVVAALTSVVFSIHDTIVVFDRVRENLSSGPRISFKQIINLSTVQTMTRSLNTTLTVVFVLLSLVLFGGDSIRGFVLALLVGIATGTYSSIFNASTLLVAWQSLDVERENQEPARGPRRIRGTG